MDNIKIVSNYVNRLSFVERTISILDDLSTKTQYEKTLFLNCCLGLLVATQQWDQLDCHQIQEEIEPAKWFIDISTAVPNIHKKGASATSVENFAYHLRNCLCHHLFAVMGDSESIQSLEIKDYLDPDRTNCSFKLSIGIDALIQFTRKYAEKKIELLRKNP